MPELAERVRKLLHTPGIPAQKSPEGGLDHGAYVPLMGMYPEADVPVLQISMPTLNPGELLDIGRTLAPLREEGVLIVGSGFFTHNLRSMTTGQVPSAMTEFDDWGREALSAHDLDALLDFEHKAPSSRLAHPRSDHFAQCSSPSAPDSTNWKPSAVSSKASGSVWPNDPSRSADHPSSP